MNGSAASQIPTDGATSYYGRPVIKPPSWRAYIPAYFFSGGLAGASATLALAARIARNPRLARNATAGALGALAVSFPLLIADLRDPKRFANMLRVIKPTSPMSIGTWLLTLFGGALGIAATSELSGVARPVGRAAGTVAGLTGPLVSTYTAALIANTAVPVWHEAGDELPFVFAGGSLASAAALALITTPVDDAGMARRCAVVGTLLEGASLELMRRRLGALVAEPYTSGPAHRYTLLARTFTLAGLALVRRARRSRGTAVAAGLCGLVGALCERLSIFEAGKQSARDPKYTVQPQHERLERRTSADVPVTPRASSE